MILLKTVIHPLPTVWHDFYLLSIYTVYFPEVFSPRETATNELNIIWRFACTGIWFIRSWGLCKTVYAWRQFINSPFYLVKTQTSVKSMQDTFPVPWALNMARYIIRLYFFLRFIGTWWQNLDQVYIMYNHIFFGRYRK